MTVRVATDSNTMIPVDVAERLAITTVPLTVVIDGDELIEDADMDIAGAYRRLRAGEPATTSAPAPGTFGATYAAIAGRHPGQPIVSIHIGATYSGTINAARMGASLGAVDVRVVDTGTVSFLAGCCVLAGAEAAMDGADTDDVVGAAVHTAAAVASVFTIAELGRANAGGRLGSHVGDSTPVLLMRGAEISPIASVDSADDAAKAMLDHVRAIDVPLRMGVGDADAGPVVDELVARLRESRPDDEIIRYVVGPTVAAHAGMGTFGIVFHPVTR